MGLSLRGTTSGAIDINAPAVAGDNTITLPNGNGSANQFFKNSDTAGIVTFSSMTESSSGVISIGDIDINGTSRTITAGVGQTVGFSTDIKIQGSVRIEDPSVSASRLAITYQGIDFQNTGAGSSDTATAHILDDYEEGTWTPTYEPQTNSFDSITYDAAVSGKYQKIGNTVYIQGFIRTDALTKGTATGYIFIGGLPFSPFIQTGHNHTMSLGSTGEWLGDTPDAAMTTSGNRLALYYRTTANGGTTVLEVADMGTGVNDNQIYFSGHYTIN